MKDYNSMKHTLLVFNSKETLVDTIIEQDKEKDRLKERLSLYESDTDTVVMSKDKWEEIKQEIERLNKEVEKYKKRCYEALTLIRENYGLLDKYGIDMLDDILNGK